MSCTADGRLA